MKLLKACIALAALAAFLVVPSFASAVTLTSPTGTAPKGDHETTAEEKGNTGLLIEATNVAHSKTVLTTIMTSSLGPIECETATLTGTLITNGPTKVEGEINTAQFGGTPGEPTTTHCKGPGGAVTVTPSHTSAGPTHETVAGKPAVTSLPWCVTAEAENKFTVKGGTCTEQTPIFFTLDAACGTATYKKTTVEGTYTTHPADAIATVSGQKFTRTTGSIFCPPDGELFMAFTLKRDDTKAAVYIDP